MGLTISFTLGQGLRVRIQDEGAYWPRRSEAKLRQRLDQMNSLVAAMGGVLKDTGSLWFLLLLNAARGEEIVTVAPDGVEIALVFPVEVVQERPHPLALAFEELLQQVRQQLR